MKLFNSQNKKNRWENYGTIPIGHLKNNPDYPITLKTHSLAEITLIFAMPGVGKSVISKNISSMYWKLGLPQVIFDPTGMDNRLNYLPNKMPTNLAPGVKAFGMNNKTTEQKVKYLNVSDNRKEWEEQYKPCLNDFESDDLVSLGFSAGASDYLKKILKVYGPFEDFNNLIEFVERYPTNVGESNKTQKRILRFGSVIKHHTQYKESAVMPSPSKDNMLKILYKIKNEKVIALDNELSFDFVRWIDEGNSVVISFDEKYVLARAVISMVAKKLIKWKKTRGVYKLLGMVFEEMDKVFPKDATGNMAEFISNLVLKLRKLSIKILGSSASIEATDKNLLENCHNLIVGPMRGRHLSILYNIFNDEGLIRSIRTCKWDRFSDYRELVYRNEKGMIFSFIPYNAPCEIHREMNRKVSQ